MAACERALACFCDFALPSCSYGTARAAASVPLQRQIALAQPLELGMLRMQRAQISVGALFLRQRLDDLARIQQARLAIQVLAERKRVGPAAAGMAVHI